LEAQLRTASAQAKIREIEEWLPNVFEVNIKTGVKRFPNPFGNIKIDHYNNPDKEARPGWMDNVDFVGKIGDHHFYISKPGIL